MKRCAFVHGIGIALLSAILLTAGTSVAHAEPAYGTYRWPVRGPVIRAYDPPDSPYGTGHRGIDVAAPQGTPVLAPASGVVAFAGKVGGERFVSVDHPDGVRTTYSWLSSIAVKKGDHVRTGQVLASTGLGHPGAITPHIHLGAKFDGDYIDPIGLFGPMDLSDIIRLAPVAA